jgi:hypothetical protein
MITTAIWLAWAGSNLTYKSTNDLVGYLGSLLRVAAAIIATIAVNL